MTLLLIQMVAVLMTTHICGWIARKLGQAKVIGEIVGGIVLGPSIFGRIAPQSASILFPKSSLGSFEVLSTIGLILFLFLIGTELDYEHLRRQKATATLASSMSILFPFLLAAALAHSLLIRFAPEGISYLPFTLFLGISMSITAFPVLARILEERGIQSTPVGTTALLCAAVDDVFAWTLLAVALTFVSAGSAEVPLSHRILWLGLYLVAMLFLVRPAGKWLAIHYKDRDLSIGALAVAIVFVLASAAATESIGVHPLFGAFLAGVCFPRVKHWQTTVRTRLDAIVSVLLLPLFFAVIGMKTRLDLLAEWRIWLWTAVVLIAAIAGKMGGAIVAARWTGHSWQYATALGALLNTRGLVELIVLNIAYSAHVFSPVLFTMLVVMALVTTAMTTPILDLLRVEDRNKPVPHVVLAKEII